MPDPRTTRLRRTVCWHGASSEKRVFRSGFHRARMGGAYDEGHTRGAAGLSDGHVGASRLSGIREERGVFLKLTEKDGLWKKIRSHAGTTVEHPVSPATRNIRARISDDGVKKSVSVCPYCAVGCSTLVYHRDGRIIDIEGNPDSPINAGTLCPKGSATFGMHVSPHRWTKVRYRRPYSSEWEDLSLEQALDMIAQRVKKARDENWEEENEEGKKLSRSMAVASVGGATIDNEENYLITKLFHSMGFTRITNQARI